MFSRPKKKKKRYSLEEVEDMLMNDPDSGDSDTDLGENLAGWGDEGYRDESSIYHRHIEHFFTFLLEILFSV